MASRYYNKIKKFYSIYKKNPEYAVSILNKYLKKGGLVLVNIPLLPMLIFFVLVIRLIKPFCIIRFGQLESEGIGHFSQPVEIYLSEMECGIHGNDKVFDCWYAHKIICNQALKNKWSTHLRIVPRIVKPMHLLNRLIPGGEVHEIPYRKITDRRTPWQVIDMFNVLQKTKPRITFSDGEKQEYTKFLKKSGFDITKKFVCLSVRDGAYHGDADLCSHRNSSVTEYFGAIDYLIKLGYQVVRIGANVGEDINMKNSSLFDYASSGIRSEVLDLFIISECAFLIGTGSGIDTVASLFRKPQVYLNITEIGYLSWYSYNSIIIFRKYQIDDEVLSISEIFNSGFDKYTLAYQFKESNIKLINNTVEEINAVLWEMHARLNGCWQSEDKDKELQVLFTSYWPDEPFRGKISAKIGTDFFRSTPQLLK